MKLLILLGAMLFLHQSDALFGRRTSTGTSHTRTRIGTGTGTSTHTGGTIGKPRLPNSGSTSTGGSGHSKPRLPTIGKGSKTGKSTASKKLLGSDVKTRIPADKPTVPKSTSPSKPLLPGEEKSKMGKAMDMLKKYKGMAIESFGGAVIESATAMAFDSIVGSWLGTNKEGASIEETPSGGVQEAEITNQCTDDEGAAAVKEASDELLNAGVDDLDSAEAKQYIQDYVAYYCAVNTAA